MQIVGNLDEPVCHLNNTVANGHDFKIEADNRGGIIRCKVPKLPLLPDLYYYHIYVEDKIGGILDNITFVNSFAVEEGDFFGTGKLTMKGLGSFLVENEWELDLS